MRDETGAYEHLQLEDIEIRVYPDARLLGCKNVKGFDRSGRELWQIEISGLMDERGTSFFTSVRIDELGCVWVNNFEGWQGLLDITTHRITRVMVLR